MCSQEITPKMKMNISYLAKQGSKFAILYASPHFPFLKNISMITLILTLETKHNSPIFIFLWIFEQMQVLCAPQGFCNGTFPPPPAAPFKTPPRWNHRSCRNSSRRWWWNRTGEFRPPCFGLFGIFSMESQSAPWIFDDFCVASWKKPRAATWDCFFFCWELLGCQNKLLHGTGIFCVHLPIDLSRM